MTTDERSGAHVPRLFLFLFSLVSQGESNSPANINPKRIRTVAFMLGHGVIGIIRVIGLLEPCK